MGTIKEFDLEQIRSIFENTKAQISSIDSVESKIDYFLSILKNNEDSCLLQNRDRRPGILPTKGDDEFLKNISATIVIQNLEQYRHGKNIAINKNSPAGKLFDEIISYYEGKNE